MPDSCALTSAFQPAPIDPGWLREQYLTRQRSYSDIAAELGVRLETVSAAARRHHIPSRPAGVHSRPEMITTLPADIPLDIRRAVEGWDSPQTVETSVVVILVREVLACLCPRPAGAGWSCPLYLPPGAAEVSGVKGGRRPSRAAMPRR